VLSRLLILPVDGDRGVFRRPNDADTEPPPALIARARKLAAGVDNGNLSALESSELAGNHATVVLTDAAEAASDKVRDTADTLAKKAGILKDLWRRAHEQTLRLALLMACGAWPEECEGRKAAGLPHQPVPIIEERDVVWGWRLTRWATARMADSVADLVADSDEERCQLAIMKAIKSGADGAGKNTITRATQGAGHRLREAALSTLLDSERIVKEHRVTRGRTAVWFSLPVPDDTTDALLGDSAQMTASKGFLENTGSEMPA
jgi:hypothetical protein